MTDISVTVESLSAKVDQLIQLHSSVKDDTVKAGEEIERLKKIVEHQKAEINSLKEKNKVLKITKAITGGSDQKNTELKLKVNEIVREVDKCIALLNK